MNALVLEGTTRSTTTELLSESCTHSIISINTPWIATFLKSHQMGTTTHGIFASSHLYGLSNALLSALTSLCSCVVLWPKKGLYLEWRLRHRMTHTFFVVEKCKGYPEWASCSEINERLDSMKPSSPHPRGIILVERIPQDDYLYQA